MPSIESKWVALLSPNLKMEDYERYDPYDEAKALE